MWANLLNMAIGLGVGTVTGLFFERRSTRAAQQHTRELEEELAALRTSIYSVGGGVPSVDKDPPPAEPLLEQVLSKARAIQNADGRLSRTLLTSHFFARGYRASDIDGVVQTLCATGAAREDGKWLEVL